MIRKEDYVGGKRKYEFLKLYLIPERPREDKVRNEATPHIHATVVPIVACEHRKANEKKPGKKRYREKSTAVVCG